QRYGELILRAVVGRIARQYAPENGFRADRISALIQQVHAALHQLRVGFRRGGRSALVRGPVFTGDDSRQHRDGPCDLAHLSAESRHDRHEPVPLGVRFTRTFSLSCRRKFVLCRMMPIPPLMSAITARAAASTARGTV